MVNELAVQQRINEDASQPQARKMQISVVLSPALGGFY
jgi:hypothetical protein